MKRQKSYIYILVYIIIDFIFNHFRWKLRTDFTEMNEGAIPRFDKSFTYHVNWHYSKRFSTKTFCPREPELIIPLLCMVKKNLEWRWRRYLIISDYCDAFPFLNRHENMAETLFYVQTGSKFIPGEMIVY